MSISEHVEEFAGLPVRDYTPDEGIIDPEGTAQRLRSGWDYGAEETEVRTGLLSRFFGGWRRRWRFVNPGESVAGLLARFLDDPASGRVVALVLGACPDQHGVEDSSPIAAALAASADRLPNLRALFLGDVTSDEYEISWISISDVTPLLTAFPALEQLRVRGGLTLGPVRHEAMKALVIESGGLPGEVVRAVAALDLPNLEHLELWLGDSNYGGDATVEDLSPILSGAAFPRLKYLGLRDCEFADALAAALADAPVLRRLETLDLSLGTLGDEGVVALLSGGNLAGLRKLDIHHHFASDEAIDGLKALGIELDAGERQEPDEYGRFVAVSE